MADPRDLARYLGMLRSAQHDSDTVSRGASRARPAVFFDRDGVLTDLVWNPATGEHESPHTLADLRLCPSIVEPLRQLAEHGFDLFIVSNQPSYAKGKTSLEAIQAIAHSVEDQLRAAGVTLRDAYYCYHHPNGVIADYTGACECRKPQPYFLHEAARAYGIDLPRSWMVGDRDSDVECGRRAGCHTILIRQPLSHTHQGRSQPEYVAADVVDAVAHIIQAADSRGYSVALETGARPGPVEGAIAGGNQ